MAGTINTQAQLQVSSSATYTTNAANLITAALVRTLNENWISSSVVIPMTSSMTVLSSSYAATASVLLGSVVSASYAYTASSATNAANSISASYALTASFALNAGGASSFPYTGSAQITGSLGVTGSVNVSNNINTNTINVITNLQTNNISDSSGGTINFYPGAQTILRTKTNVEDIFLVNAYTRFTGSVVMSGSFIVTGSAQSNVVSQSVASSTASIDSRAGNSWFIQLPATSTTFFNFTNLLEGQTGNIIVSGSSAGTASFSSNVKQVSGSAYNNSTVGGIDVLSFSTWNNNVYLVNSKQFI